LALDTITEQIGRGGLRIDIEQANGTRDFQILGGASLSMRSFPPMTPRTMCFRPDAARGPWVTLLPGWLTDFRQLAYRRTRQGRGADRESQTDETAGQPPQAFPTSST